MLVLKQSTSVDIRIGPAVSPSDGVTPVTGATIAAADQAEVLKANGAATVAMTGTLAAVTGSDGWYDYTVQTGDVDTVGEVVFVLQDASAYLPLFVRGMVVEEAIFDAYYAASATGLLPANVTQISGAAVNTSSAQLGVNVVNAAGTAWASGAITSGVFATDSITSTALAASAANEIRDAIVPPTNTALNNIMFLMVDSTDGFTAETGLTVTGQRSIDAGSWTAVGGTITEVGNGMYQFDAAAADMNGSTVTFRFSATGAADTFVTIPKIGA